MAALTERAVLAVLTIGLLAVGSASAQVGPDARPYIYGRPAPDRDDYAPPPPGGRPPPPPADDGYGWRPPRRRHSTMRMTGAARAGAVISDAGGTTASA